MDLSEVNKNIKSTLKRDPYFFKVFCNELEGHLRHEIMLTGSVDIDEVIMKDIEMVDWVRIGTGGTSLDEKSRLDLLNIGRVVAKPFVEKEMAFWNSLNMSDAEVIE